MFVSDIELKQSAHQASTLGQKLRSIREMKKLTQMDVSRMLCLSVAVIDALECENYNALPNLVFVRGYYRSYANFLQVPELIPSTTYTNHRSAEVLMPSVNLDSPTKLSTLPQLVRYTKNILGYLLFKLLSIKSINYGIVLILAAMIFIGWHDKHRANQNIALPSLITMSEQKIPFEKINSIFQLNLNNPNFLNQIHPWWPLLNIQDNFGDAVWNDDEDNNDEGDDV